ncbi:ABC transporter substrate-binding protein [Streptomyces sp. NBC_01477]|uniref:ABC transporter substrate-binding protein n=1 Tax=Streptomyces sp. NBC_01477 TaxID=2976015 RepID=UPI002E345EF6|nr:extracellular solute-binding protein [Streptomyces sp. NBC_01477]
MTGFPAGSRARIALAVTAAAGLTLALSGCGSSSGSSTSSDGVVTITVNDMPAKTDPVNRKIFLEDVSAFEKLHPKIKVVPHEGQMDPQTFSTKLAGGQLENAFYVYYTDPAGLIAKHQAADITPYLSQFPAASQVKPQLRKVFQDAKGHTYGLPEGNYSMGLVYNRTLFQQAGLDPDKPPTTWDEVRADAKKIVALGHGTVGYGDYSKSNTGGWHFTAEMYSRGGDVAKQQSDGTWKADFDNATGKAVLQQLHDMRWTDNSMGERQLLEWADLLQMMGAGKLGMYLATSDNIPSIVAQYKGDPKEYGQGPIPGGQGTLAGGGGFMFNPKDTPEQIKAAMAWVMFKYENPDRIALGSQRASAAKQPVGLPEPNLWTGAAAQAKAAADAKYANVPVSNYAPFQQTIAGIPLVLEPPKAQQIYAVLDTAMATVLTRKDADIDSLLSDASKQVDSLLAAQ